MINLIQKEDLRKMKNKEGLILQGCGGEPKENRGGASFGGIDSSVSFGKTAGNPSDACNSSFMK